MKYWILTFMLVATALANTNHIFYEKVNGEFVTLTDSDFLDQDSPDPRADSFSSVPVFTFEDDIAYTGHGENKKYFAYDNGVMVLGSLKKVKPFELHVNEYYKIVNINRRCKPFKPNKCHEVEIYLLSPSEVSKQEHEPVSFSEREDKGELFIGSEYNDVVEKRHVSISAESPSGTSSIDSSVQSSRLIQVQSSKNVLPIRDIRGKPKNKNTL